MTGPQVRQLRQRTGLSLRGLARILRVNWVTIWCWEQGRHAIPPDVIRAAFVAAATPYLRAFRPLDGLCTLLEETARRRRAALPLAAVVAQSAAPAARLGPMAACAA